MEGVVNNLFWEKSELSESNILGKEKTIEWTQRYNVATAGYLGWVFQGSACKNLLEDADFLLSEGFLAGVQNKTVFIPVARTLQVFNKLVSACFGCKDLEVDVAELVEQFSIAFIVLDRSIPLKFHVVMEHLIPSLANFWSKGFGFTIEQTGESIHQHFQTKFWDRFKITSLTIPTLKRLVLLQTWILLQAIVIVPFLI